MLATFATITLHTTTYVVTGRSNGLPDITRSVQIAVVRRRRGRRTTAVRIVDAGDATQLVARQQALHWYPVSVEVREVVHPPLGSFDATDEGRDAMLDAVRALQIAKYEVDEWGLEWSGRTPARLIDDAGGVR